MDAIFKKLSIEPVNGALYQTALTHPSASKKDNYERLEFLGDAVIELITTQYIFQKFPNYDEGKMTKLRALTVSRPTLASFARDIGLPAVIKFSSGESGNNGRKKDTNLCNCFEALMGAIYLDLGYEVARDCYLSCAQPLMDKGYLEQTGIDNPKGKLQEILQEIRPIAPRYEIVSTDGPDHDKTFVVKTYWSECLLGKGQGSSKQRAESAAALDALTHKRWVDLT